MPINNLANGIIIWQSTQVIGNSMFSQKSDVKENRIFKLGGAVLLAITIAFEWKSKMSIFCGIATLILESLYKRSWYTVALLIFTICNETYRGVLYCLDYLWSICVGHTKVVVVTTLIIGCLGIMFHQRKDMKGNRMFKYAMKFIPIMIYKASFEIDTDSNTSIILVSLASMVPNWLVYGTIHSTASNVENVFDIIFCLSALNFWGVSAIASVFMISSIAILVEGRTHTRRSYLAPCSMLGLLITIFNTMFVYKQYPNKWRLCHEEDIECNQENNALLIGASVYVLASILFVSIGCIYIMAYQQKHITKDPLFKYTALCMMAVLFKALFPESTSLADITGIPVAFWLIPILLDTIQLKMFPSVIFMSGDTTMIVFFSVWAPLWLVYTSVALFISGTLIMIKEHLVLWEGCECKHNPLFAHTQHEPNVVRNFYGFFVERILLKMCVLYISSNAHFYTEAETFLGSVEGLHFYTEAETFLGSVEGLGKDGSLISSDEQNDYLDSLLRLGTNLLLRDEKGDLKMATSMAIYISMFEKSPADGKMTAEDLMLISRSLAELGKRDIMKFYSKRAKCSCLNAKYKSLPKESKRGICCQCKQLKKPKELFLCTGCRSVQYCSKDCQRKHWNRLGLGRGHKDRCQFIANSLTQTFTVSRREQDDLAQSHTGDDSDADKPDPSHGKKQKRRNKKQRATGKS